MAIDLGLHGHTSAHRGYKEASSTCPRDLTFN